MAQDKLKQMKTAGFILKPNSPEIKPIFESIRQEFEKRDIRVELARRSALMISEDGIAFDEMCANSDFLVSLGGDGTLLSLVRRSYTWHKPVVGINAGNLGFLADVKIEEVSNFLEQLIDGCYRIDKRLMIAGHILKSSGAKIEFFALNDVVISSPTPSKMVIVNASIEGEKFNTYRGDGLIISTPTGSTAYNLAAGGPVIYPLTRAFILTPVLAHSLTNQRPLLVPSDFAIEFNIEKYDAIATIDGQERYEIEEGDRVFIAVAREDAKLLHRKERNYFSVLRDKLHWGDIEW